MKLTAIILAAALAALAIGQAQAFQNHGSWLGLRYRGLYLPDSNYSWCYDVDSYPVWGGRQVVQDADANWGASPYVTVTDAGDCDPPGANMCLGGVGNGYSQVTWVNNQLDGSHANGMTCYSRDATTGAIYEADIVLDYANIVDANVPATALALHEIGHALGLGHDSGQPSDSELGIIHPCALPYPPAMCYPSDVWHTTNPTTDDLNGLRFIYHDRDGDGCTGLEEYSDYLAFGGGTAWDGNHRIDKPSGAWYSGIHYDFADVNGTRNVNISDKAIVQSLFGSSQQNRYDQNGDGVITISDVGIVTGQVGQSCVGGPE